MELARLTPPALSGRLPRLGAGCMRGVRSSSFKAETVLRVAFVYPPIIHESFEENLKVVDEDFGRLPPISLAYAAAIAEKAGHRAVLLDVNALGLTVEETIAQLREFRPDVLGFTLTTYMFRETTRWMGILRDALKVPTIVGGVNLRLYPAETLEHEAVDYGVLHFGTRGLPLLLEAIESGRCPAGLPEVVARDEAGRVVIGPIQPGHSPFPDLPPPARHLLPNDRYYSIISQRRPFTVMVTGTGCPARCSYCAIPDAPRFRNSVSGALDEVRQVVRDLGVREIDFFDADFFAGKAWTREFCQGLIEEKFDLEWSCRASIDSVTTELLALAKKAGCRQIYVGLETPDENALASMHRGVRPDKARRVLGTMHELGIRALGFFMIGVPGETHATARGTIAYALSLPIDYAQFSRMIAKPGSEHYRQLVATTGSDYWRDFVLQKAVPERLPNPWSRIGERAIEAYTRLGYVAFYYRPRLLARSIGRMRSLDEVHRSGRTALRMLGVPIGRR